MTKREHKRIENAITEDIYQDMKMLITGFFIALGMHIFNLEWGWFAFPAWVIITFTIQGILSGLDRRRHRLITPKD